MLTYKDTGAIYHLIDNIDKVDKLIKYLSKFKLICFDTETTSIDPSNCKLVGVSFCVKPNEAYYVPAFDGNYTFALVNSLHDLFQDSSITWIGQNIKYDLLVLRWLGVEVHGNVWDTMVASYLLNPEERKSMDYLSEKYLNYETIHIEELIGKKERNKPQLSMKDVDLNLIKDYAAEDADVTYKLYNILRLKLIDNGLLDLHELLECKLLKVIVDIEFNGVSIDTEYLKVLSNTVTDNIYNIKEEIFSISGKEFNINSTKQLGEILYDDLKVVKVATKTKTGKYATGVKELNKMTGIAICKKILEYRELTKIKNTYLDSLPEHINIKSNKIHASFNQCVARTGRLSSSNPNLQNIPIRTELGAKVRKAFIANEGEILISADYSQIELRILAAVCGDPNMISAFQLDKDIHTATAAKVFKVKEEDVTKEQRRRAKTINFGICYGQGAYKLAEDLGIHVNEAKKIISDYKNSFKSIFKYIDNCIYNAKKYGYSETLLNRKRIIEKINSKDKKELAGAERMAYNTPIQGTAADMIKIAMIMISRRFKENKLKSKIISQVHDELLFISYEDEIELVKNIIREEMENALPLPNDVPCKVEIGVGKNWGEAH